jgi:hypothetical protein
MPEGCECSDSTKLAFVLVDQATEAVASAELKVTEPR